MVEEPLPYEEIPSDLVYTGSPATAAAYADDKYDRVLYIHLHYFVILVLRLSRMRAAALADIKERGRTWTDRSNHEVEL